MALRTAPGALAALVAATISLCVAACGETRSEQGVAPITLTGKIGGCEVNNHTLGLKVGLFGLSGQRWVLIAQAPVEFDTTSYTLEVELPPDAGDELESVPESQCAGVNMTVLTMHSFVDKNGDGDYGLAEDGDLTGSGPNKVYFFDGNCPALNAVKGYNHNMNISNGYSPDFSGTRYDVTAGETGC